MDQGLIPKRYAKALYLVAKQNGNDANLYKQMQSLTRAFAASPALNTTMQNPFISDADKAQLIYTACGASAADKAISDFVKLLEQNHRIGIVRDIAAAYQQIYREANDIYQVKVVSAAPLSAQEEARLKALILSHLNGGSMEYSVAVDPELIGGFVVNIDNERLDASVRNELKQLRLSLLSK